MDWIIHSSIFILSLNSEDILWLLPESLLLHSISIGLLIVALIREVVVDRFDWIGNLWVEEFLFLFAVRCLPLLFIEDALFGCVASDTLNSYWLVEKNLKDLRPSPSALLLDYQRSL